MSLQHLPFLNRLYIEVDFDRELVFRFFTIFSLFEYALKKTGFVVGNREDAQPDWDKFAATIHGLYDRDSSKEYIEARDYLLKHPPKKQVVVGREVVFRNCPANRGDPETMKLSVYIRRVRNNLFHGGKFRYERPRDTKLIESSLTVLEVWVQCNEDVRRALEEMQ